MCITENYEGHTINRIATMLCSKKLGEIMGRVGEFYIVKGDGAESNSADVDGARLSIKKREVLRKLDAAIDGMDMPEIDNKLLELAGIEADAIKAEDTRTFSARIMKLCKRMIGQ
jgi:hypothetical protein